MENSKILIITTIDKKRLLGTFNVRQNYSVFREYIQLIDEKLNTAKTVTSKKVPPTVVTMNSRVEVKNVSLGKAMSIELVYPDAVDPANLKISVFSPLGASILGHSQGDEFFWTGRNGKNRFLIEKILYQPEAAGDYHL